MNSKFMSFILFFISCFKICIHLFLYLLGLFLFRTEIVHVWRDSYLSGDGPKHSAQMVVDSVSYLTETMYSISAQPSKALTDWVADKIAPTYWKQNSEIIVSEMGKGKNNGKQYFMVLFFFINSIAMLVKQILNVPDYISIIAVVVAKVFVIHVQRIKCQCRHVAGVIRFVFVIHAKIFYPKKGMRVQVNNSNYNEKKNYKKNKYIF